MKVVSTNIGEPTIIIHNGQEVKTGLFKFPIDEAIFLGNEDVVNDHVMDRKHHGGADKACYLYSADHYKYWQKIYPELEFTWGMFGENLTVEGLHEADINIGNVYQLGEALVQVTQPRQPCFKLISRFKDREIVRKFVDSGFPGVYVRVLKNGYVKSGASMKLVEQNNSVSIQQVFKWIYADEFDPNVSKAINEPLIAASCKRDLLKRWGKQID